MVVVKRCASYDRERVYKTIVEIFELLGGIEKYIKPGMKVVIKPNLVMAKKPEEAATTHPMIVEAVARHASEAGGNVLIADSPGGPYTQSMLKWVYSVTGMEKAARESGSVLNYDTSKVYVDNPAARYLKRLEIIRPVAEADVVINLPKLKTHGTMVYTGAVKNMFGTIAGIKKADYHFRMPGYNDFSNALIDIFLACAPALNIMDAVVGMEGHGPTAGHPRDLGCILASGNGFELDCLCLDLIGVNPSGVPFFMNAVERGLCPADPGNIHTIGDCISDLKINDFIVPNVGELKAVSILERGILKFAADWFKPKPVFHRHICTGCGHCSRSCPAGIIEMADGFPQADLSRCISCMCCQELCPAKAVKVKKRLLPLLFLKEEILKKRKSKSRRT